MSSRSYQMNDFVLVDISDLSMNSSSHSHPRIVPGQIVECLKDWNIKDPCGKTLSLEERQAAKDNLRNFYIVALKGYNTKIPRHSDAMIPHPEYHLNRQLFFQ